MIHRDVISGIERRIVKRKGSRANIKRKGKQWIRNRNNFTWIGLPRARQTASVNIHKKGKRSRLVTITLLHGHYYYVFSRKCAWTQISRLRKKFLFIVPWLPRRLSYLRRFFQQQLENGEELVAKNLAVPVARTPSPDANLMFRITRHVTASLPLKRKKFAR